MTYKWDLKNLYKNKEEFYSDMTLVRDKLKKLFEYRKLKIDGNSLYDLMNNCFSIREINYKTLLYASLNYYIDIDNKFFIKMKKQAEELDLDVLDSTNFIDELIVMIDQDRINHFYVECNALKKYKFYIDNVRRMGIHIVNNDITSMCSESINRNLINYNSLIKNINFEVNGNVLNSSNVGSFLVNKDRSIRKKSFNELNNTYLDNSNKFFDIFKSIIDSRQKMVLEKKYSSVLESEIFKDDINSKFIDNLINYVNKNIFLMNKYLSLKCRYLNIEKPYLYDINIPIIDDNDSYDLFKSLDILNNIFKVFGDKYVDVFKRLINESHLELECDDKKHPNITFSWNTYMFTNYKNRYVDLKNLAHELGHIVNSYYSIEKQPFIYSDSTVFVGEVASLVNEILLNDYLYKNSSVKNKKIFYLTKIIENFISQVYRQTMYTEFENLLYNKNQLDLDYVCNQYLELVKKYYGDVINVGDNIASEWMRIGHLFRWSYYVYKYASGYILAFNVIDKIKDNDISNYIDFLSSGCSCSNYDLLKKLDIDLYDEKLMIKSFNLLERYINELEVLLNEEK